MYLDLTSSEKPVLQVKLILGDGSETVINVLPASKKIVDKLTKMKKTVDDTYRAVADILSCNTNGRTVTIDDISGINIIDIRSILSAYVTFIGGISSDPN